MHEQNCNLWKGENCKNKFMESEKWENKFFRFRNMTW